jgi:putative transposase
VSQTYAANFIHCVFSTKGRKDLIAPELRSKLWAYIFGIGKNLSIELLAVGGTANHVHVLIGLPPTLRLAEAIQKLKANSSRWMGEQNISFEWQKGYGAFSVSPSLLKTVKAYIRNQEQHHRKRSFEEEFRALLQKSGIAYDERLFAA